MVRLRRSTKPRDELMDAITAAAAAGNDEAVAALSEQARLEALDRRHRAVPLPPVDAAEVVRRIDAEERNR